MFNKLDWFVKRNGDAQISLWLTRQISITVIDMTDTHHCDWHDKYLSLWLTWQIPIIVIDMTDTYHCDWYERWPVCSLFITALTYVLHPQIWCQLCSLWESQTKLQTLSSWCPPQTRLTFVQCEQYRTTTLNSTVTAIRRVEEVFLQITPPPCTAEKAAHNWSRFSLQTLKPNPVWGEVHPLRDPSQALWVTSPLVYFAYTGDTFTHSHTDPFWEALLFLRSQENRKFAAVSLLLLSTFSL